MMSEIDNVSQCPSFAPGPVAGLSEEELGGDVIFETIFAEIDSFFSETG
jgi:hypothetical protein